MSPPPVATVIRFRDAVFCRTVSVTLPPSALATTWYWVPPGGTTTVTLPPLVLTRTSRGTRVKTISTSPPPVRTVTCAAVTAVARMFPPPVLRERSPAAPSADTSPPPVDTDTAVPDGTLRVAFSPQFPKGMAQRYLNAATPAAELSVMCGRTRL